MGGGGGGGEGGEGTETTGAATSTTTTTTTVASRDADGADNVATVTSKDQQPALHVIVLGSGGGPIESNTTAFLVRSLSTKWSKGSVVAVDAGVHLGSITNILEKTQPASLGRCEDFPLPYTLTQGPFRGLEVPNATHKANAAHIHRNLIDTYLITHPHLDHISGFVVNTAGLPGARPKRLAGLPSTIAAFKAHIFNNVIWPNLSDENNGAGLVTYMRLVEGGSPALGEGEGRGYLEICDGLAVKIWGVSHGHCIERHSHRGSGSVRGSFDASSMGPTGVGMGLSSNAALMSPRALAHHNSVNSNFSSFLQQQQQQQQQREHDRMQGGGASPAGTAALGGRQSSVSGGESVCVYDSSAYFIRDVPTGREILIFGDVEPDSVSLSPRNQIIWQEAAPKIAKGNLAAIFIECSYDDSQPVDRLYGHLTPKFIVEEMCVLAQEVEAARLRSTLHPEMHGTAAAMERSLSSGYANDKKKRKRESADDHGLLPRRKSATPTPHGGLNTPSRSSSANFPGHLTPKTSFHSEDAVSPKTAKPSVHIPPAKLGPFTNKLNSSRAPSSASNDSRRNSIDSSAWSAGGGAMASVMGRGRSSSRSGSCFDSPHLATPTAELSLQDLGDDNSATDPVTPLSMNHSGSLPPPIMQTGGYRHEPQSMVSGSPGRMLVPAADGHHDDHYHGSYAVGPLDHTHPHEEKFNPSADYDVSMGMVPEESENDERNPTPTQRNGNGNHHHAHPYLRTPRHDYEEERVKVEDMDEDKHILQDKKPAQSELPLRGLKVVIIHVKDKLNDERRAEDVILEELLEHESNSPLGIEYMVSESGQDLYL